MNAKVLGRKNVMGLRMCVERKSVRVPNEKEWGDWVWTLGLKEFFSQMGLGWNWARPGKINFFYWTQKPRLVQNIALNTLKFFFKKSQTTLSIVSPCSASAEIRRISKVPQNDLISPQHTYTTTGKRIKLTKLGFLPTSMCLTSIRLMVLSDFKDRLMEQLLLAGQIRHQGRLSIFAYSLSKFLSK